MFLFIATYDAEICRKVSELDSNEIKQTMSMSVSVESLNFRSYIL